MKKIFTLLILSIVFNAFCQDTKKALFLGNSYTAANSLPTLVKNLANANGDDLIHDQNTPGGYTFNGHSTDPTTLNKITANEWDYVVLQAQSQEPSFPPGQVATQTKPYAVILNDSIQSNNECTQTMFFMTWGRENGDASNCAFYTPLCTYEGMQQRLRESYLEMAVENDASVAPVGMAWKKVREDFPAIDLYTADGSHPNINGSYLAACVFYSSMFNKTTVGNTYWSSLDSLTAFRLQNIASSTVLDSLDVWRIDTTAIVPNITDSIISACDSTLVNGTWFYADTAFSDTIVIVSPCAIDVVNYEIDITNSNTEIIEIDQLRGVKTDNTGIGFTINATNYDTLTIYLNNVPIEISCEIMGDDSIFVCWYDCGSETEEQFEFIIEVSNSCSIDSAKGFFRCGYLSSIDDLDSSNWNISPNPTNNYITIESNNNLEFSSSIVDLSGREVIQKTSESRIDLSSLEKGIYFVVIYDKDGNAIGQKKVLKN